MNGPMREATERRVDWPDVDEDTFARLCEFAYLGDYTVPMPPPLPEEPSDDEDWEPSQDTGEDNDTVHSTEEDIINPAQELLDIAADCAGLREGGFDLFRKDMGFPQTAPLEKPSLFETLSQGHDALKYKAQPAVHSAVHSAVLPRALESCEDFTPVLLGQARLYALGDKYGMDSLCQLVVSKTYDMLKEFFLDEEGLSGLIEFVQFVYLNTPPTYEKNIDPMRHLAVSYIISILDDICNNEEFYELLREGGDFVVDFWRISQKL